MSKEKLVRFVEHRVGDPRVIRLIQKWLKAGILEDGVVTVNGEGERLHHLRFRARYLRIVFPSLSILRSDRRCT